MNADTLAQRVWDEIESYRYECHPEMVGNPKPPEWIDQQLLEMRNSVVAPYRRRISLRETFDQVQSEDAPVGDFWVVAEQGRYLVFFDTKANEFGLAECFDESEPVAIGVRGDAVGVFMAR